jgi:hypothetical protein
MSDRGRAGGERARGPPRIKNYMMNFRPQHPAAHGVMRLIRNGRRPTNVPTRISVCCTAAQKN